MRKQLSCASYIFHDIACGRRVECDQREALEVLTFCGTAPQYAALVPRDGIYFISHTSQWCHQARRVLCVILSLRVNHPWGPVWGPSHTHLKLSRWSREYTIFIKFTEDAKCGMLAMLIVLMSNFCLGHSCFCTKITPATSILPCYYHRGDKGSLEHSKFWCKILKSCECSLLLLYSRCTNVPCVS